MYYVRYRIGPLSHMEFLPIYTTFEVYDYESDFLLTLKKQLLSLADDFRIHLYDDGVPCPLDETEELDEVISYIDRRIAGTIHDLDDNLGIQYISIGDYDLKLLLASNNLMKFCKVLLDTYIQEEGEINDYSFLEYISEKIESEDFSEKEFIKLFNNSTFLHRDRAYSIRSGNDE